MPAALVGGSVDAISIFDPFARIAERELGDEGITFADADIYSELYVVDVMQKTIDGRRADLLAFLRGLHEAETFIREKPDESKAIVIKYTKLDRQIVDETWENAVFKVALNQLFLDYTNAQAQWAIAKGDYPSTTPIPDFRQVLAPELLAEIAPDAVQLEPAADPVTP
jgi:ABC-type nitrate/sulfonate/bicarbonate transport system substrate-binding protein